MSQNFRTGRVEAAAYLSPDAQFPSHQSHAFTLGIDTTTSTGRVVFHIFGALAEFERDIIRERTLAGLEAARRRGRKGGRPRALTEEQLPMVQRLMQDEETTTREICETFSISRATLYRYVSPEGELRR